MLQDITVYQFVVRRLTFLASCDVVYYSSQLGFLNNCKKQTEQQIIEHEVVFFHFHYVCVLTFI